MAILMGCQTQDKEALPRKSLLEEAKESEEREEERRQYLHATFLFIKRRTHSKSRASRETLKKGKESEGGRGS